MPEASARTLISSSDGAGEAPEQQLVLVAMGSPERGFDYGGRVFSLDEIHRVRFGRSAEPKWEHGHQDGELEIAIPLPWVSSLHAELRLEGPRLRLVDMGSRNGTLVENTLIQPSAAVGVGRVFEIGRSFWMLRRLRRSVDEVGQEAGGFANTEIRSLLRAVARLAPSNVPILLTGETGTGKDRLARALHVRSGRSGPFLAISAVGGSIERLLLDRDRLMASRGGTLYLADVGELGPEQQARLTNALMRYSSEPGHESGEHALRIVSSTARNLRGMVATGTFRPDLLSRLAGYEARLPPLRARREDLGLLVNDILRRHVGGETVPRLSTEVFRSMLVYSWPFNLRELEHTLVAACGLADSQVGVIDFDQWAQARWSSTGNESTPSQVEAVRRKLVKHLVHHRGELHAVAVALGCEVIDVERWVERFSLQPERFYEPQ